MNTGKPCAGLSGAKKTGPASAVTLRQPLTIIKTEL